MLGYFSPIWLYSWVARGFGLDTQGIGRAAHGGQNTVTSVVPFRRCCVPGRSRLTHDVDELIPESSHVVLRAVGTIPIHPGVTVHGEILESGRVSHKRY